jgi:hypothetical protein
MSPPLNNRYVSDIIDDDSDLDDGEPGGDHGTLADDVRALTQSRAMMSPPHLSPVVLHKTHLLGG